MPGFGTVAAGGGPFGYGTPLSANPPPSTAPEGGAFVNFRTGDYGLDSEGEYQRMPVTRQRVMILLSTVLDSATAQPGVGLRLPAKINRHFKQGAEQAIREALSPIGRDIRIDGVQTVTRGGRADIQVSYTDLTTGNSDTVTV